MERGPRVCDVRVLAIRVIVGIVKRSLALGVRGREDPRVGVYVVYRLGRENYTVLAQIGDEWSREGYETRFGRVRA